MRALIIAGLGVGAIIAIVAFVEPTGTRGDQWWRNPTGGDATERPADRSPRTYDARRDQATPGTRRSSPPRAPRGMRTVKYSVTGTARAAGIRYHNETAGTTSKRWVPVPWRKTIYVQPGARISLRAQNEGETGTVVVEMMIDDTWRKRSQAQGRFAVASVYGRCP
jgi:hypothetical protein